MKTADLRNPIFTDEDKAREHFERLRWPDGQPFCPHCGVAEGITKLAGKSHRPGLYQCNSCRGHFTVRNGSIFERSHLPLRTWALGFHLMAASKKGMSAHQLHRMLGVTYKSAWFMAHRIREAMRDDSATPMGGSGKTVEADETYYGNTSKRAKGYRKGHRHKASIVALVEPGGRARAFHVNKANVRTVREVLVRNVDRKSFLHTDESRLYVEVGDEFEKHQTVLHTAGEYVGPEGQTTNHAENFFGLFKRSMVGTYHKCDTQHVQKYLDEVAFRYSNRHVPDTERAALAVKGAEGKRLTYR